MKQSCQAKGRQYYEWMGQKKRQEIEALLGDNVCLISPMAKVEGKEAVLRSIDNFLEMIESLTIRQSFGEENEAVVVYDIVVPFLSSVSRGASYLSFEQEKLVRIELFYDATPFIEKKDEVFGQ